MNRLFVTIAFAVLVVAGGATAYVLGVGPVGELADDAGEVAASTDESNGGASASGTSDSGADASSGASGGDGSGDASASGDSAESDSPFTITIDQIEECGQTCRDVTATIYNNQDRDASDVVVTTRILADGDQLWTGTADLGTIPAGGSETSTKRVKLGYMDAYKVKQNGGYVTIETTIDTANGSVTFSERRKVA